jgi:hypothetical protein
MSRTFLMNWSDDCCVLSSCSDGPQNSGRPTLLDAYAVTVLLTA